MEFYKDELDKLYGILNSIERQLSFVNKIKGSKLLAQGEELKMYVLKELN